MTLIRALTTSLLAAGLAAAADFNDVPRRDVAGGESAPSPLDYPSVVLVYDSFTQAVCAGTRISPDWVLTAAHCVDGSPAGRYYALHDARWAGYGTLTPQEVQQVEIHPQYAGLETDWKVRSGRDVALLRLSSPLEASTLQDAHLADDLEGYLALPGTQVTLVGYGKPTVNEYKTAGETTVAACAEGTAAGVICTENLTVGIEAGDSGGPLLYRLHDEWIQIGVNSSYDTTGPMRLSRHVNVLDVLDWIEETAAQDDPNVVRPPGPPPPPPPFVPQAVSVALGTSGDIVTLMTTEAGGYTLNSMAFPSGSTVQSINGDTYTLTLDGTTWSARKTDTPSPPPTVSPPVSLQAVGVALGCSGEAIVLFADASGNYTYNGSPLASFATVEASNGDSYLLTRSGETWTAVKIEPDGNSEDNPNEYCLPLGDSGQGVKIHMNPEEYSSLGPWNSLNTYFGGSDFRPRVRIGGKDITIGGDGHYFVIRRTFPGETAESAWTTRYYSFDAPPDVHLPDQPELQCAP